MTELAKQTLYMNSSMLELVKQILLASLVISISTFLLSFIFLLALQAVVIIRVFNERSRFVSRLARCNCNSSHGLSTEELEKIPSFEFEEDKGRMVKDCVVCLENFKDGDICKISPSCGHYFHKKCIDYWLLRNANCPICRSSFVSQGLFISK